MCSYPPYFCFPTTILLQELGQLEKQNGVLFSESVPWFTLLHKQLAIIQEMQQQEVEGGNEVTFQQQPGLLPG